MIRSALSVLSLAFLLIGMSAASNEWQPPIWQYYGGDQGGQHFSSADQINTENVVDLEVAWVYQSGDMKSYGKAMAKSSTQSTPILLPVSAGASLVYCTPFSRVIALDPTTGKQRWDFDPKLKLQGDRPFRCRGVSYYEDNQTKQDKPCRHRVLYRHP